MITPEVISQIISAVKAKGDRIDQGLSDAAFCTIQGSLGVKPPELWTSIWTAFSPQGEGWPDWNTLTTLEVESLLKNPTESIESDVLDGLWLHAWGERPQSSTEALRLCKSKLIGIPALLPLRGHRYISCDQLGRTGPVLSVMGFDTIFAAPDLITWFEHEFSQDCVMMSLKQPMVPFWGELASGDVEPLRLPALFR